MGTEKMIELTVLSIKELLSEPNDLPEAILKVPVFADNFDTIYVRPSHVSHVKTAGVFVMEGRKAEHRPASVFFVGALVYFSPLPVKVLRDLLNATGGET